MNLLKALQIVQRESLEKVKVLTWGEENISMQKWLPKDTERMTGERSNLVAEVRYKDGEPWREKKWD